jgi:hypothetical protein
VEGPSLQGSTSPATACCCRIQQHWLAGWLAVIYQRSVGLSRILSLHWLACVQPAIIKPSVQLSYTQLHTIANVTSLAGTAFMPLGWPFCCSCSDCCCSGLPRSTRSAEPRDVLQLNPTLLPLLFCCCCCCCRWHCDLCSLLCQPDLQP